MSRILGYADPLVSSPSDKVGIKVSCARDSYESTLLRLGPGLDRPAAPPVKHIVVQGVSRSRHPGRLQFTQPGSFLRIASWQGHNLDDADSVAVSFWCQPTLPDRAGHKQFLFSQIDGKTSNGFACLLDEGGNLCVNVGTARGTRKITFPIKLLRHRWYHVRVIFDRLSAKIVLLVNAKGLDIGESSLSLSHWQELDEIPILSSTGSLIVASDVTSTHASTSSVKSTTFNGKMDTFKLETCSKEKNTALLHLDFSKSIRTDEVQDVSGNGFHGELVNAPSRAVTSHDWDASQVDWTRASSGYGAIHFHDDDVDDAMWETDFELQLPKDIKSGCYGVLIEDGNSSDIVPLFVRPKPTAPPPPVVVIIPTFTYAAYANEHMFDTSRDVHFPESAMGNIHAGEHFHALVDRPDLGISLYDSHNDGSGTITSSTKRPMINMRPDYFHWGFGGPREFGADLWFIGFLDRELGVDGYDVITDHDLSAQGSTLLKKYKVALSCSHPEYPTYGMLDAYAAFLAAGGFFLYLGGNGFYWVTSHDPDPRRSHRIEVRRGDQGCRTFGLPPGNWHHSTTGEYGGLWRSRGRPATKIFGLIASACGMGTGAAYGVSEEARSDPRTSFLFRGAGLETASVIGDFGLVQGAASGDEIDRLDYSLGTPSNAVILATTKLAGRHSDNYGAFNEEIMFPMINTTGTTCDTVRSDLIYFDTHAGGAVFSVGSINWVGAMAWKDYENNVAQITANALHEFIRRAS